VANDGYFIGVDLGGTSILAAAVRQGDVLVEEKKKTRAEQGPEAIVDRVEAVIRKVLEAADDEGPAEAICIGAPGAVDRTSGVVRRAPNLGWENFPLGEHLEKRLGLPVILENDVNIGVVGEHVHGAGRGSLHVAAIFVGTGVGGGLVINGLPVDGFRGAAGEFGHIVVKPQGRLCPCGREGCVEAYSSKTAMEAMVREKIDEGRQSIVLDVMHDKGKDNLTSSVIEKALEEKDEVMGEVVRTAQYYLGLLTADVVNAFDPEVIVFGGGVVERLAESFVDPIALTAREHFLRREGAERIRIVPAALGDHAGTVGAAVIAQRSLHRFSG
jgi:glucokinase